MGEPSDQRPHDPGLEHAREQDRARRERWARLSDAEVAVLALVVQAPQAWLPLWLPEFFGRDPETVAGLVAAGILVAWESDGLGRPLNHGPYVTLTPWGAWLLQVDLIEAGRGKLRVPKWRNPTLGEPEPKPRQPKQRGHRALRWPETVPDPGPPPIEYLLDEVTEEPVQLWGTPVPRSKRRLKGKGVKAG